MYSVKQAAERLGVSDRHLRLLLERGEIQGKKIGHYWVVLKLNYKRKRRPKGGQNIS
jgi:excisionase family DNA binding protein